MIKSLEGGRGLAALIVALYHLRIGAEHFSAIRNGYLFVDLFFVLSGFVICSAYAARMNDRADFRSFFIRRAGRLVPLLLFSTIFFVLMANAIVLAKRAASSLGYGSLLNTPGALDFVVPTLSEIAATLTLTHGMGVFDRLILNTPSWSISTEFYTYLLFAAVCIVFAGRLRLAIFGILAVLAGAVCVAASLQVHDCLNQGGCLSLTYDFGFPRSVFSFFMGALLFYVHRRRDVGSSALQLAGLILLGGLLAFNDVQPALAFGMPFVFALLILSVANDHGILAAVLKWKPFQVLGQRSYSIYLMHMPLMLVFENIARRVKDPVSGLLVVIAYVTVLLIISGWTYRWIEDPFRIRFNRLAGRLEEEERQNREAASVNGAPAQGTRAEDQALRLAPRSAERPGGISLG